MTLMLRGSRQPAACSRQQGSASGARSKGHRVAALAGLVGAPFHGKGSPFSWGTGCCLAPPGIRGERSRLHQRRVRRLTLASRQHPLAGCSYCQPPRRSALLKQGGPSPLGRFPRSGSSATAWCPWGTGWLHQQAGGRAGQLRSLLRLQLPGALGSRLEPPDLQLQPSRYLRRPCRVCSCSAGCCQKPLTRQLDVVAEGRVGACGQHTAAVAMWATAGWARVARVPLSGTKGGAAARRLPAPMHLLLLFLRMHSSKLPGWVMALTMDGSCGQGRGRARGRGGRAQGLATRPAVAHQPPVGSEASSGPPAARRHAHLDPDVSLRDLPLDVRGVPEAQLALGGWRADEAGGLGPPAVGHLNRAVDGAVAAARPAAALGAGRECSGRQTRRARACACPAVAAAPGPSVRPSPPRLQAAQQACRAGPASLAAAHPYDWK